MQQSEYEGLFITEQGQVPLYVTSYLSCYILVGPVYSFISVSSFHTMYQSEYEGLFITEQGQVPLYSTSWLSCYIRVGPVYSFISVSSFHTMQ